MKKKEFKRTESLLFLALEIFGKAVELKRLQVEERKLKFDENKWLQSRSGNKVGSRLANDEYRKKEFPSGGMRDFAEVLSEPTGKEFVIPSSLFPIQGGEKYSAGCVEPISENIINLWRGISKEDAHKMFFYDLNNLAKSPKEIHEETLENGLKTEKKCETASALLGSYKEGVWYKSIKSNAIQFNKKNGRGDGINDFGTVVKDANWLNSYGNGEWRIATEEESAEAFYKVFEND